MTEIWTVETQPMVTCERCNGTGSERLPDDCGRCRGEGGRPARGPRSCPNCGGDPAARGHRDLGRCCICAGCTGTIPGDVIPGPCPECGLGNHEHQKWKCGFCGGSGTVPYQLDKDPVMISDVAHPAVPDLGWRCIGERAGHPHA